MMFFCCWQFRAENWSGRGEYCNKCIACDSKKWLRHFTGSRNLLTMCTVLLNVFRYSFSLEEIFRVLGGLVNSFIHLVVCLTTGSKPHPKRALHIVRSRASSFKWEYLLLFLRSSSSFLRLLSRLPVTSIPPFAFPSITRRRKQFYAKCDQSS